MTMGYINLAEYKLFCMEKVSSTQEVARSMIDERRACNNCVVVAAAQSNGRGRYNRKWVSHHGNLYVSFIYKTDEPDGKLSYSVAVAVANTLTSLGIAPQIKWPNDILVDGKKISGILIEYYKGFAIIGIGINIETCPTVPDYKTTKISKYVDVSIDVILSRLLKNMKKMKNMLFSDVRDCWMNFAMGINKRVKYKGKIYELVGINDRGALILRDGSKYILIYGDEVGVVNKP